MEVIVEGVSYLMQTQKSFWENPSNLFAPPERTLLLNNINLYLKSGSITCFLGTGDGQKRLLELIALKQTEGFMSGNILHDNLIRPNGNYKDIAYVTRDNNTYYEGLTVFDYLYFGARLRLTLTQIETREKIREVIKLVGLDGGLKINRLRKGEMVLLAIALELVNSPTLLILDNPVRSLEYGEALEVVRGLKRISRRKTHPITVIFIAEGVNEDMLRLVDNISIFTSMRMSFNISLFEYNKNSYMDVASVAPALNNLYVLIAEASAELLRRPKHLQTTVVEDNLLKVCTDLNVLKEAVESELLAEHHSRMHSPQHSRDSGGSGGGMPPSLPSINAAGDSRGPSDSFDSNYISMSPLQSGLSRSASHALPSRPSVNPNDVHPDLDRFYRTDSFTATTLRSRQTRGRNEDSIESQKRTFKPVLQELEVLVSREFMFTLSNVSSPILSYPALSLSLYLLWPLIVSPAALCL
jgi:ABC-type multidrug transport system ATPase subunit